MVVQNHEEENLKAVDRNYYTCINLGLYFKLSSNSDERQRSTLRIVILLIWLGAAAFAMISYIVIHFSRVIKNIDDSFISFGTLTGFATGVAFYVQSDKSLDIRCDIFNKTVRDFFITNNKFTNRAIKRLISWSRILSYCIGFGLGLVSLVPLLTVTTSGEYILIADCSLPWNNRGSIGFWFTYLFESVGILICGVVSYAVNAEFICVWTVLIIGFHRLQNKLKDFDYSIDSSAVKIHLVQCVKIHQQLLKITKLFDQIYCYPLLLNFISLGLTGCLLIASFLMRFENDRVTDFTNMPDIISTLILYNYTVLEVIMYGYLGHILALQSSVAMESIYFSNWYEGDLTTQKLILMYRHMSKDNIKITVGKLVPLNANTIQYYLKASYSFLTLLRNK